MSSSLRVSGGGPSARHWMTVIRTLVAIGAVVSLLLPVTARAQEPPGAPPALNDGWAVAAPAEVGLDPARLARLTESIRRGEFGNVHALLIERDGKLVYEEYFEGEDVAWGSRLGRVRFGRASLHDLRSVSKSVTSTLVGIAIDRGLVESVEAPLRELLPDRAHLLTGEKASIRLRDVLTMSAGLEWDEWSVPYSDPVNDERRLYEAEDPIAFVLERPLVDEPGTRFVYSGGLTQVLAAVVEEATGREFEEFAREALFRPLGIYDVVWRGERNEDRMPAAASGLRLRARDLAKLGSVFLDGGLWGGARIVSEPWVTDATRHHLPIPQDYVPDYAADVGYGYQWWTVRYRTPRGDLLSPSAVGNGDQRVILLPELDVSVTLLAGLYDSSDPEELWMPDRLVVERVLPAITGDPVNSPADGGAAGSPSGTDRRSVENTEGAPVHADTLLALTERYDAAWEDLDAEAILGFHPEDFVYYWRGRAMPSREVFEQVLREQILPAAGEGYSAKMVDPRVQMVGPDAGIVSFQFRSTESQAVEGAASFVWERRNGAWKIIHVHESGATSD